MSGGVPAARVGDPIAHSNAGSGMLIGALIGLAAGAVLVGATIATGGAALAVVAAVGGAAGLTSFGGLSGMNIGGASMGPPTGQLVVGSQNVRINGRFATMTARGQATCSNHSGQIPLATGASTVLINGLPAGRIGEKLGCSAVVVAPCSPNVNIGSPSVAEPNVVVSPEVPAWAVTGLQVLGVAGAVMALPYAIATVGVAATIGGGVAGYFGGEYGGKGGRALGTAMGMSETGIRSMEAGGQFFGGMLGGAAGTKGGVAANARLLEGASPAVITSRRAIAQDFYAKQGWPQGRIDGHLGGIDFAGPVRPVTIPQGTQLSQWQTPGRSVGNYFAPARETPSSLGIAPNAQVPGVGVVPKQQVTYTSNGPVAALRSTAAPVKDTWSVPGSPVQTEGGGRQYFVPNPSLFSGP